MDCPVCHSVLNPGANFCERCGQPSVCDERSIPGPIKRPHTISALAFLDGILAVVLGVITVWIGRELQPLRPAGVTMLIGFGGLTAITLAGAFGLWHLREFGRSIQSALAWVGILFFPFGTVLSLLVLPYINQPGVRVLFSRRSGEELTPSEIRAVGRSAPGRLAIAVAAISLFCGMSMLTAVVLPSVGKAIDRGRQQLSMMDLHRLATVLEGYATDEGHYPEVLDIYQLHNLLGPDGSNSLPALDGWGHPYVIRSESAGYVLISSGKDGVIETRPQGGPSDDVRSDIIFGNGRFVQWPDGTMGSDTE